MFLTHAEIERLTGKKRHKAQILWLREHGYKVEPNGLGEPIVAIAEYNRKAVGGARRQEQEPNWSEMHGSASA
jgi:hypothetical protein